MTRLESITHQIEEYASDSHIDGYHQGYDEAWDESRDKGFDEGYDAAIERILEDWIQKSGFAHTPETLEELQESVNMHKNNGPLCVMMTMNFLHDTLQGIR